MSNELQHIIKGNPIKYYKHNGKYRLSTVEDKVQGVIDKATNGSITIIWSGTDSGKTYLTNRLMAKDKSKGVKSIMLMPTRTLVANKANDFKDNGIDAGRGEKWCSYAIGTNGSVQLLTTYDTFTEAIQAYSSYDIIYCDEVHLLGEAGNYRANTIGKLLDFKGRLIGLTGTPFLMKELIPFSTIYKFEPDTKQEPYKCTFKNVKENKVTVARKIINNYLKTRKEGQRLGIRINDKSVIKTLMKEFKGKCRMICQFSEKREGDMIDTLGDKMYNEIKGNTDLWDDEQKLFTGDFSNFDVDIFLFTSACDTGMDFQFKKGTNYELHIVGRIQPNALEQVKKRYRADLGHPVTIYVEEFGTRTYNHKKMAQKGENIWLEDSYEREQTKNNEVQVKTCESIAEEFNKTKDYDLNNYSYVMSTYYNTDITYDEIVFKCTDAKRGRGGYSASRLIFESDLDKSVQVMYSIECEPSSVPVNLQAEQEEYVKSITLASRHNIPKEYFWDKNFSIKLCDSLNKAYSDIKGNTKLGKLLKKLSNLERITVEEYNKLQADDLKAFKAYAEQVCGVSRKLWSNLKSGRSKSIIAKRHEPHNETTTQINIDF